MGRGVVNVSTRGSIANLVPEFTRDLETMLQQLLKLMKIGNLRCEVRALGGVVHDVNDGRIARSGWRCELGWREGSRVLTC
jgi:hypothetical protein